MKLTEQQQEKINAGIAEIYTTPLNNEYYIVQDTETDNGGKQLPIFEAFDEYGQFVRAFRLKEEITDYLNCYEIELKPCPFCGNEFPEYATLWALDNGRIYCSFCNAQISGCKDNYNAAKQWNNRPAERELLKQLDAQRGNNGN